MIQTIPGPFCRMTKNFVSASNKEFLFITKTTAQMIITQRAIPSGAPTVFAISRRVRYMSPKLRLNAAFASAVFGTIVPNVLNA